MKKQYFLVLFLISSVVFMACAGGSKSANNSNNVNNINNCTDQCTAGESYCNGNVVMSCVSGVGGCLGFSSTTDCAGSSQICQLIAEVATCVTSCNDLCTADQTRCTGELLERCTADGNGCLSFTAAEDCAATSRTCEPTPTPGCVCAGECTADECAGTVINGCAADAQGCLHLGAGFDCATQGKLCQLNAGVASCVCDGGCTIGLQQCSGTVIESCVDNGSGCGVWQSGTDCAGASQQCRLNGAVAECFTPAGPVTLLFEEFTTWNSGWTVVDGGDTGYTWVQCDNCSYENLSLFTTKVGAVALIDSDYFYAFDDYLVSPAVNCSSYSTVTLEFDHYLKLYTSDWGQLDVSIDGGSSWTSAVRTWNVNTFNVHESINLSAQVAGQANVKIRFRYVANFDWCWMIDNVRITAQ